MVATPIPIQVKSGQIRKINLSSDLPAVADLIELCFPIQQDPDGQTYVKEMRKAAHKMRLMGSLAYHSELGQSRTMGFVWEDHGRILGNLSLIPLKKDGRRVHLIANVAVHPDFRRRGIARILTQRALAYLGRQGESQVWLQVRDDNQPAVDLYCSLGFKEQAARTTWRIRPVDLQTGLPPMSDDLSVRRRKAADWLDQRDWLEETYPDNIRWNLPVNFRRFEPGLLQGFTNFMEGVYVKHWAVTIGRIYRGVITWQKSDAFANNLWLAVPVVTDTEVLSSGLIHVIKRLPRFHPLSIDFPAYEYDDLFRTLGFEEFRTLIWMCRDLR